MRYEVIDGDGHIVLPSDDWWKPYLPKKYWGWGPEYRLTLKGRRELWAEGRPHRYPVPVPASEGTFLSPSGWRKENPEAISIAEARRRGGSAPKDRLKAMDKDGVNIAYLYPSEVLSLHPSLRSSSFALAMVQAYNNWLADFCSPDSHRLRGVAVVTQQDTVLAVEEAERMAKKGMRAIMLRPNPVGGQSLDHANYERIWGAAQDLDIAVGIHEGLGVGDAKDLPRLGVDRCHNMFQAHVVCHPFEHMTACLLLITGGVFYRHRKLRVGFLESGAGWAPFWLNRMDEHHEKLHRFYPEIEERPSETFKRQCFLGVEPDDHLIPHMVAFGLEDTLVFSSDFPHYDAIFPGSVAALANRTDISEDIKRKVLRHNPLRLYGGSTKVRS